MCLSTRAPRTQTNVFDNPFFLSAFSRRHYHSSQHTAKLLCWAWGIFCYFIFFLPLIFLVGTHFGLSWSYPCTHIQTQARAHTHNNLVCVAKSCVMTYSLPLCRSLTASESGNKQGNRQRNNMIEVTVHTTTTVSPPASRISAGAAIHEMPSQLNEDLKAYKHSKKWAESIAHSIDGHGSALFDLSLTQNPSVTNPNNNFIHFTPGKRLDRARPTYSIHSLSLSFSFSLFRLLLSSL